MSRLTGKINRIGSDLRGGINRIGSDLRGGIDLIGERLLGKLCVHTEQKPYILFAEDKLFWGDSDNQAGVIKYNTLFASGAWSLEEIEIEELL